MARPGLIIRPLDAADDDKRILWISCSNGQNQFIWFVDHNPGTDSKDSGPCTTTDKEYNHNVAGKCHVCQDTQTMTEQQLSYHSNSFLLNQIDFNLNQFINEILHQYTTYNYKC